MWFKLKIMEEEKVKFRIIFVSSNKIYEIYARVVTSSAIYGFIEVSDLILEKENKILVDPNEDELKREFEGVKRMYIPFHSVVRIDEIVGMVRGESRVVMFSD